MGIDWTDIQNYIDALDVEVPIAGKEDCLQKAMISYHVSHEKLLSFLGGRERRMGIHIGRRR